MDIQQDPDSGPETESQCSSVSKDRQRRDEAASEGQGPEAFSLRPMRDGRKSEDRKDRDEDREGWTKLRKEVQREREEEEKVEEIIERELTRLGQEFEENRKLLEQMCQEGSGRRRYEKSTPKTKPGKVHMWVEGHWVNSEGEDTQGEGVLVDLDPEGNRTMPTLTSPTVGARGGPISAVYNCPLIQTGNRDKYRPFGVGDVQALVDKLPPVAEGGGLWLSKLDGLTAGQKLALGDFRAVISRCLTTADVRDIEDEAQTTRRSDEIPFTQVSTDIGRAMRGKYPLPNASAVPKIKWDPKQNPRDFLDKAKEAWITQTGCHPGKTGIQREWYRKAVLKGVPDGVRTAMEDNPDMAGCESTVWERHLIHHLSRTQETLDEEQNSLKDLQAQLLKMQLAEARQKVNDKKKNEKPRKVMVAAGQVGTPDLFPVPPWIPPPPNYGYTRGLGRGRGMWGSGRGRGGPPRGQQGGDQC